MSPDEFSKILRDALRDGAPPSPLALIPKNKRPFYRQVITDFEAVGSCFSPSGMTASIIGAWLKKQGRSFVIEWDAEQGGFWIRAK